MSFLNDLQKFLKICAAYGAMVGYTYGDYFLPARGLPLDSLKGLLGELKFLALMKSQFLSLFVYGYYFSVLGLM